MPELCSPTLRIGRRPALTHALELVEVTHKPRAEFARESAPEDAFESAVCSLGGELAGRLSGGLGPADAASYLERLYAIHGRAVQSHCLRLLGDLASAEDATQEVFLRVRRAVRLPPTSEMRPWLFRVATNYCLNELRRRSVRAYGSEPAADVDAGSFEDALAARSVARDLLEQLTPRARAVTWLTYVDGMLQREVAAMLGVSRRTVVSELNRAHAALVGAR